MFVAVAEVVVAAAVAPVVVALVAVALVVPVALAVAPVVGLAAVVAALVEQQPEQLAFVAAGVYSVEDPCAGVDAVANDSSDRRLFHICHKRVILYDSYHPCDAVDVATNHAFARNHDRNQDKRVVLVSDLILQVVMFALHHAYG